MVRGVGFQGQPLVKVSLWPQFAAAYGKINKGDFVAVDGKYSSYTTEAGKLYHSINAKYLQVNGEVIEPAETQPRVANAAAAGGTAALPF